MSECYSKHFFKNNELLNEEEYNDSVLKSGKSIYEVIRVQNQKPIFFEKHLKRLLKSVEKSGYEMILCGDEIKNNIKKLCEIDNICEGNVKLFFNYGAENNAYLYFIKHNYPSEDDYKNGVYVELFKEERKNPNVKEVDLNYKKRVTDYIMKMNCYEVLLVDNDNYVREGSRSNIFFVKGNNVLTADDKDVLSGISREVNLELLKEMNINIIKDKIKVENLEEMDGAFISGTSPRVLPIQRIGNIIYNSSENKIIRELRENFNKRVNEYINNN